MRSAVFIGINDYPNAPLTACIRDAEAMRDLLEENGDNSPNFDTRLYRNVQTKGQLTEIIHNLFKGENDVSLLYFSGHGYRNGIDTFLVTPDAEDFSVGLSVSELLKMANDSRSKNRVIILDCCYSGAAGSVSILGQEASILHKGVSILTASRSDEESKELSDSHGIFTDLLLQALGGGAANITGHITAGSIYAYIDQVLGAHDQRPAFKTNITEFVPLRKVGSQVPVETLRKLTTYFPRPEYEFPLDPSYEQTNSDLVAHKIVFPHADPKHVTIFRDLQKYQSIGLVVPINAPYMYDAAMNSTACRLTPLGMHYWRLVRRRKI
jgi:hypothetical protein